MSDQIHLLNQKVRILQNSLSFDLQLTFEDIIKDLHCTKQQMAQRFQLIVQQKQILMRKQIGKININNLKILQDKTVYFEQVNKNNKILNEELNKRNMQISELKDKVNCLNNTVHELQISLASQQKKFKQFQDHTFHDYKRLQIIERKHKDLLKQIQEEKNGKNELKRRVEKIRNEAINWSDRINYLMKNRQKGLKQEYANQIGKLKDILMYYEHNNKCLRKQQVTNQQEYNQMKRNYQLTISKLKTKYGLDNLPKFQSFQVQTQDGPKKIDVGVQIRIQCRECKKIKDVARHNQKKTIETQTDGIDRRVFRNTETQTLFRYMQKQEEESLQYKVKQVIEISQKQKQIYILKLKQLYQIIDRQPSRLKDLNTVGRLENSISQKDKVIENSQYQLQTLKSLNKNLHSEIDALKLQLRQKKDVKFDNLEFRKKNKQNQPATQRLFTEKMVPNVSKIFNKRTLEVKEKDFSQTIDVSSTLTNFKTKRSKSSALTLQMRTRTPDLKVDRTFFKSESEAQRWQKMEQKIMSPQLFSASPHVNASRREKYRRFSMLKKRNHQHEQTISFTVAF